MDEESKGHLKGSSEAGDDLTDFSGYFDRWLRECRAMANHAFGSGQKVPTKIMRILEHLEGAHDDGRELDLEALGLDEEEVGRTPTERLTYVHNELARTVCPASPKTILLMADETDKNPLLLFLGRVPFVRKMMATAMICLAGLIGSSLSPYVNADSIHKTVFDSSGTELLVVFIFLLSAAGLGASFSALFRVNKYIAQGTFDPTYETSYWIRFLVGLISGLILTQIFSFDYMEDALGQEGGMQDQSARNAAKVTLALLGGFSADLVFNILNRMVETVLSFVLPDKKIDKEACKRELEAKFASKINRVRCSLTKEINLLRQKLPQAEGDTQEEIDKILDRCFKKISDDSVI